MSKHKKKKNKRNSSQEYKTKFNYIYTVSDRFKPILPLYYNKMNHSNHDKIVTILKNDVIGNGAHLVIWNMEYGWKGFNPTGEIDVLEYYEPWKALGLYEVKSSPSSGLLNKGKSQLNRMIDNYVKEFDSSFNLDLKKIYTFLVNVPSHKSLEYKIRQHRKVKL